MELKVIIFFIFLAIAILFLCGLLIYKLVKKRNMLKVMMVRDKYIPTLGKFFLYIDKSTGIVQIDKAGDKCMFFESQAEAQFILDQYQAQKGKPAKADTLIFY